MVSFNADHLLVSIEFKYGPTSVIFKVKTELSDVIKREHRTPKFYFFEYLPDPSLISF